jgi:WD40 repeat protein
MLHVADARTGLIRKSQTVFPGRGDWSDGSCIACSPDGVTIALTTWDNNIILLDARSLELVRRWPNGHTARVSSVAFSPDSRRMLTTSEDGMVRVWEAATGTRIRDLVGHASRVWCAADSPDGKRIATGGSDHNVRIWNAETFDQVGRLSGHEDYVYSLVWRADSQQLITGSGDGTVRIWDTQSLIDRQQARRERKDVLAQVEPLVRRLVAESGDISKVVERIKADPTLGTRTRRVALQVALRMSVEGQTITAP